MNSTIFDVETFLKALKAKKFQEAFDWLEEIKNNRSKYPHYNDDHWIDSRERNLFDALCLNGLYEMAENLANQSIIEQNIKKRKKIIEKLKKKTLKESAP